MDIYTFTDLFVEKLLQALGKDCWIELREVARNNGKKQDEILIRSGDVAISTIYSMNSCYELYRRGKTIESLIREIVAEYRDNQKHFIFPKAEHLKDFNRIKDRLFVRLMNRNWNQEYLRNKVYGSCLDLAAVYYIDLRKDVHFKTKYAGVTIIREVFQEWNIPLSVLHKTALENMRRKSRVRLQKLDDLLKKSGCNLADEEEDNLWILKNENDYDCGATALLYPDLLEQAAEKIPGDFYIIPSSVCEILLYPEEAGLTAENLKDEMFEANHTFVKREELLSNHIYYYDAQKKTVSIAI